jgi:hypothetical protein
VREHRPPIHFAALVVDGVERERLARVHDALVCAGPLPELPDSLARPTEVGVRRLPAGRPARRRRRPLLAAVAAAFAVAAAGAAYSLSVHSEEGPQRAAIMRATAAALAAHASLRIGEPDAAGNWPVTLRVRGLPPLPVGSYYEMYLTNKGRIVGGCGTFETDPGTTVVRLNVPYRLSEYGGWLIRRERPHGLPGPPLLTT